jgi:hypothetical protein
MKNKTLKILFVLLFIRQVAYAQSARTFIKGTDLVAETQTAVYSAEYIEIWNVGYSTTNERLVTTGGRIPNEPNEKPQSGVLSFTKNKSKSSIVFFEKMVHTGFADAEIAFAKFVSIPSSGFQTYLNFKAKDVRVLAIKDNGDFTETIELLMPQVFIFYRPSNPTTGELGPQITYGWNFLTHAFWNGN